MKDSDRAGRAATVFGLAALTAVLGLRGGGADVGGTAVATVAVGAGVAVWLAASPAPLAGMSRAGWIGSAALGALALLDLVSQTWSDSSSRALLEFDRTLLYALTFFLFAAVSDGARTLRLLVPAVAAACTVVAGAAFLARAAPQLLDVAEARTGARLAWPLGYWNALGLVAASGVLLAAAVVVDAGRHAATRAAFASTLPVLAVAGYLTLSRGAALAVAVGLAVLLLGRGRAALAPLAAALTAAGIAVYGAYRAEGLVFYGQSSDALQSAGGPVVTAVVLCTLLAAGLAWMLARATAGMRPAPALAPAQRAACLAGAMAAAVLVAVAIDVPGTIDEARKPGLVRVGPDIRDRLTHASANGRLELWEIALTHFADHPLLGGGAGTYEVVFNAERTTVDRPLADAHSLPLEFASERGLLGLTLLLAAFAAGAAGLVRRGRGIEAMAVAGAVAAWLAHSALDRDWEFPAASLWVFAVLGAATATAGRSPSPRLAARAVAAIVVLALLYVPLQTARSQGPLTAAQRAFERGDCEAAAASAQDSADVAGWRTEPHLLLAVCAARAGDAAGATRSAAEALEHDPDGWEARWVRAVVDAVAGAGSVSEFASASAANPLNTVLASGATVARFTSPEDLPAVAERLSLELEGAPDATVGRR